MPTIIATITVTQEASIINKLALTTIVTIRVNIRVAITQIANNNNSNTTTRMQLHILLIINNNIIRCFRISATK